MGRKTVARDELTEQIGLRLPREMLERLKPASGGRGVGEEIRRRVQLSFDRDASGPETAKLLDAISRLAHTIAIDAKWSEDPYAFQAFRAGVVELLNRSQPHGGSDENPKPPSATLPFAFFSVDDPAESIGRMLARVVHQETSEQEPTK